MTKQALYLPPWDTLPKHCRKPVHLSWPASRLLFYESALLMRAVSDVTLTAPCKLEKTHTVFFTSQRVPFSCFSGTQTAPPARSGK
jgi:hypothetical protein